MIIPKVSVIIPVYKAEAWIERCARSLFGQTLEEAEFVFVDDCSPDGSIAVLEQVIEEYPHRKEQVSIIRHMVNKGVSTSRQDGLDAARGEYVIHCDPDDWVEPDMLLSLYAKAKNENADMVICDFYQVNPKSGRKRLFAQKPDSFDAETVQQQLFRNLHGSVWNKLVRLEVIQKANVRFPEDYSFCEDLTFNTELLNQPLKIAYLPEAFYNYIWNATGSSLASAYSERRIRQDQLMYERIIGLLTNRPETAEIARGRMGITVAARILWAGALDATEFKSRFAYLRKYIDRARISKLSAVCLKLALSGHMRTARALNTAIQRLRRN